MSISLSDILPGLRASLSTAKKELIINFRYPLWFVFWAIMPIFWLLPLVFQGQALLGGRSSQSFANLSGNSDYITFNIIGSSLYAYVMSALWGMGLSLRIEQWSGTLEVVMISPISKFFILLGKAMSDSLLTSFYALVQFILATLLLGANMMIENLVYVVMIVVIMIMALYGVGFVLSGIILMYKEPGALLNFINTLILIICPVNYPLRSLILVFGGFGNYLLMIGLLFPLTHALEAIRTLLLPGFTAFVSLYVALFSLIGMSGILIAFGMFLFNHVDKSIRKRGALGSY
ncbi:MAG: hypothetical protein ACUVQY_00250 [Thermoproteota archaeon]